MIVDTCVLADALFRERPRHAEARQLLELLGEHDFQVMIPAHAFFELASVAFSQFNRSGKPMTMLELGKDLPVNLHLVPIDAAFVSQYLVGVLAEKHQIDSSGGDMVFLCLAKVDGLDLVTEDGPLAKKAVKAGVSAYSSKAYIAKIAGELNA
ncbi:type II toxin-antitoxin system VapC family toxin [Piscinibacterium candidicorallinum]|uniref:type II toxin-antitoxin system VapC family toxin n=1 Tax=Piscinibacterium candidicorallinum TaxID=1793872 RepID=UPI003670E5CB